MVLLSIVSFVFGVLGIILFFKVWGMCNDVDEICTRIKKAFPTEEEKRAAEWLNKQGGDVTSESRDMAPLKVGDDVIYEPMNRKMVIKEITPDGSFVCVSYKPDGKEEDEGTYKPGQVKRF